MIALPLPLHESHELAVEAKHVGLMQFSILIHNLGLGWLSVARLHIALPLPPTRALVRSGCSKGGDSRC
jgi:hypothetical protein